jgi:hypothetical protein
MWGDTGRYMLVPVNTTTCKHTHTHTLLLPPLPWRALVLVPYCCHRWRGEPGTDEVSTGRATQFKMLVALPVCSHHGRRITGAK